MSLSGKFASQVKYAAISAATLGDNALIAAAPGIKYRVISMVLIAGGAVNVTLKSGASTSLTGAFPVTTNSGFALPESEHGWMETAKGEALNINLSGAVQVSGCLSYIAITANQVTS